MRVEVGVVTREVLRSSKQPEIKVPDLNGDEMTSLTGPTQLRFLSIKRLSLSQELGLQVNFV